MLSLLSSRELGLDPSSILTKAESTRRSYCLELSKYKEVQKIYDSGINSLDLDQVENRYLLSGGANGIIAIFDLHNSSGSPKVTYPAVCTVGRGNRYRHKFAIGTVQWYPLDTGMFVSSGSDKLVKVWDTNTLMTADEFTFSEIIYCHDISKIATKHCLVAVGTQTCNVNLLDLKSGSKTHTLRGHKGAVLTTKWSTKDEFILATGSADSKLMLWDIRSAKGSLMILDQHNGDSSADPNSVNTAHSGIVNGLCFTKDGFHLLSFGTDQRLRLWNTSTGKNMLVNYGRLDNQSRKCIHFAVSEDTDPDIVFIPADSNIATFNVETGESLATLRGHYYQVNGCIVNPDTQELYSCGNDRNILLWTPETDCVTAYETSLKEGANSPVKGPNFTSRTGAVQDNWSSDED